MRTVVAVLVGLAVAVVALGPVGCSKPQRTVQTRPEGAPIVSVSGEDSEMNAAIAEARRTLGTFVADLQHPRRGQSAFLVKAAMKTDEGGIEHIWLSDVRYASGLFTGVLTDEPAGIKARHQGDTVSVPRDDVSDWAIVENGGMRGGYTQKVLEKSGAH